jgi:hypothetical protein
MIAFIYSFQDDGTDHAIGAHIGKLQVWVGGRGIEPRALCLLGKWSTIELHL